MEQRISFITLGVSDLARSEAFYRALGWTPSAYGEGKGIVFFQIGGAVLSLFPRGELAKDADLPDAGHGFSGVTLSYNTRTEAEVETVLAQAVQAGAKVLKPAARAFWGGYTGYFADADGHSWEVCFNPHVGVQEDGTVRLPS